MKYYIGIDIGGSHTAIGLVRRDGVLIEQEEICTPHYETREGYIDKLKQIIRTLALEQQVQLEAIGVGAPNGNYFTRSIESPPNLPWKGSFPLAQMLEQATGLPVLLTNDANAAAMGELHYGIAAKEQIKDFVMVTLGTGLGSGIVVNGELIYGHDGFAGELGHVIIQAENGRLCGCGRRGCLERYVSASGLVISAKEALHANGLESSLYEIHPDRLTSKDVYHAALEGDEMAIKIFDITAKHLALALANTCTITSPEAFIFFGGMSKAGNLLLDPLRKYFEQYVLNLYRSKVRMLRSAIPENQAAVLGAAALAIDHALSS
jgi:glucokinase